MCPRETADPRRALRRHFRAVREAYAGSLARPARVALDRAIAARVLARLPRAPAVLGCFAACPGEPDPTPLAEAARAAGWRLAFPRVAGPDRPLAFHLARAADLVPGFRGIAEPPADLPRADPAVLLVPFLAADAAGHRLGQGGGHYDRTLAALRARGPVLAIGLGWDVQLVPALEPAPWDAPLDAIATPTRFLWAGGTPR